MAGASAGVLMLLASTASAANIVVNCLGEQTTTTTEGSTAAQNWPVVLGTLLGTGYTVNQDGDNGGTVLNQMAAAASTKAGPPNIVVIGPFEEHDFKLKPAATEAEYQTAYDTFVSGYTSLTPTPKVFLMTTPPASFVFQGTTAEETFSTNVVKPAILAVAAAKNLPIIDLFDDAALGTAADGAGDSHFNAAGMMEVAKLAYDAITGKADGGAGGGSGASTGATSGATSGTASGATSGATSGTASGATSGVTSGTASGATSGVGTTSGTVAATGSVAPTSGSTTTPTSGATTATAGVDVGGSGAGGTTSGTGGETSGSNGTGTGTTTTGGTQKSSSGCTMGAAGGSGTAAGLLSLMGLAFIVSRKRASHRS